MRNFLHDRQYISSLERHIGGVGHCRQLGCIAVNVQRRHIIDRLLRHLHIIALYDELIRLINQSHAIASTNRRQNPRQHHHIDANHKRATNNCLCTVGSCQQIIYKADVGNVHSANADTIGGKAEGSDR